MSSIWNFSGTASTSTSKGDANIQKDVSCFLKCWNLDLNSSLKTPTSVAYFAALKDTDLALSFKVESALCLFWHEPILKKTITCS
jgi:hypothetical protein